VKRFAAHFIFLPGDKRYDLHSVEIDDTNRLCGISPLDKEIAATSFFNGILFLVNKNTFLSSDDLLKLLENSLQQSPETSPLTLIGLLPLKALNKENPVELYHLEGIELLPAKFGANNSCCHRHVQRLC